MQMIYDLSQASVFLQPGPTDMRKAINSLFVIVKNKIQKDPFSGSLFLFCNKKRNRMKILYWDRNGFCLWLKRLEKDKFPWPMTEEEVMEIGLEKFKWLLSGIDFFHAHKKLIFSKAI